MDRTKESESVLAAVEAARTELDEMRALLATVERRSSDWICILNTFKDRATAIADTAAAAAAADGQEPAASRIAALEKECRRLEGQVLQERSNFSAYIHQAEARLASLQRERAWLQSVLLSCHPVPTAGVGKADRSFFCIRSTGRTATQWISAVLNMHPDINCVHGPDLQPWRSDESPRERTLRMEREMGNIVDISLDSYFDALEVKLMERCCGTIHGIFDAAAVERPKSLKRTYHVAVIARNPVHRVLSFATKWIRDNEQRRQDWEPQFRVAYERTFHATPSLKPTAPAYDDMSFDDRMFVHACYWMFSHEYYPAQAPVFPCEELTAKPDVFAAFVRMISGGLVTADAAYLEKVFAIGTVDKTRDEVGGAADTESLFNAFPDWRKRLFAHLAARQGLFDVYRRIGYDLDVCLPWAQL